MSKILKITIHMNAENKDKTMWTDTAVNKSKNMFKTWCTIRIRIWIGINTESRIQIRIGLKTTPIHNTTVFFFDLSYSCFIYTQKGADSSAMGGGGGA